MEPTKRCTRCQEVKPWSAFYRAHNGRQTLAGPRSECKACNAASVRENKRRRMQDPEYRARHNAYKRELAARLRHDPEWVARNRDYKREWQRRKRGTVKPRTPLTLAPAPQHGGPRVDPGPFRDWLLSFNETPAELSLRTGVVERRLRSILNGEQETVEFDTVDRALTHYGEPWLLDELYPMEAVA